MIKKKKKVLTRAPPNIFECFHHSFHRHNPVTGLFFCFNNYMKKIWDRKNSINTNETVENYTVGIDYLLDLELLPYDIEGTMAHTKMLHKIKILSSKELGILVTGLNKILSLCKVGKFKIDKSQEDGHTAIEAYLTENYGDVGKKVHTGRSRNDQALTMNRLFS